MDQDEFQPNYKSVQTKQKPASSRGTIMHVTCIQEQAGNEIGRWVIYDRNGVPNKGADEAPNKGAGILQQESCRAAKGATNKSAGTWGGETDSRFLRMRIAKKLRLLAAAWQDRGT